MNKNKNAPLFPQTTRSNERQLSFHDFEKRQLPTLDEVQFERINLMGWELRKGKTLSRIDQMELVDIALSGVKSLESRNKVAKELEETRGILNRFRMILESSCKEQDKNKIISRPFDVVA